MSPNFRKSLKLRFEFGDLVLLGAAPGYVWNQSTRIQSNHPMMSLRKLSQHASLGNHSRQGKEATCIALPERIAEVG